jgi:putative tryptophan/tyrosine transport system substrate-binding protein
MIRSRCTEEAGLQSAIGRLRKGGNVALDLGGQFINVQIDTRWVAAGSDRISRYAAELAAFAPDVIVATGSASVGPLQRVTRSVPIVFVTTVNPVGGGFVESIARPGTNATGFTVFEYGMSGKWLELLKQIASPVARAAVIRDPEIPWRGQPAQGARLAAYSRMLPTEKNNVVLERKSDRRPPRPPWKPPPPKPLPPIRPIPCGAAEPKLRPATPATRVGAR